MRRFADLLGWADGLRFATRVAARHGARLVWRGAVLAAMGFPALGNAAEDAGAGAKAAAGWVVTPSRQPAAELLARCEGFVAGAREGGECLAFVDGFVWGHGWRSWRDQRDMFFCPPETAPVAEVIPALVAYLRQHPERLDQPSHVVLFVALAAVWPCEP